MGNRLYVLTDGEWVQPSRRFRFTCCDCVLVHAVRLRVQARHIQFRVFQDKRATAARRRRRVKS